MVDLMTLIVETLHLEYVTLFFIIQYSVFNRKQSLRNIILLFCTSVKNQVFESFAVLISKIVTVILSYKKLYFRRKFEENTYFTLPESTESIPIH